MLHKSIPSDIPSLSGPDIERGLTLRLEEILPNRETVAQAKNGNKCGHNPTSPKKLVSRETSTLLPWLVQRIKRNASKYYFDTKTFLKDIGFVRSERREAIALVAEAIATYTDIESREVKYPSKDGTFTHVSIKFLVKVTGLRSRRVMRALKHLVAKGYLAVTTRNIKRADGSFRALTSIRTVSIKFLLHLGIKYKQLMKQINKRLADRLEKVREQHSIRESDKLLNSFIPSPKFQRIGAFKNATEYISRLKLLTK